MAWGGVVGLGAAKMCIREILELPFLLPPGTLTGIRALPSAVLLWGPPGTGKTLLAEASAAESGLPLFSVSPSSILSMYLGEAEKALARVFEDAAASPPRATAARDGPRAIVFIDEVDALGGSREQGNGGSGGGGSAVCEGGGARRVLNELLLLLTRFAGGGGGGRPARVLVLAATNRPQDVDPALLRRFQRQIFCGLPLPVERLCLMRSLLAGVECALGEDALEWLAGETTFGWSCSDLTALLAYAAMEPLREALAARAVAGGVWAAGAAAAPLAVPPVELRHIEAALAAVGPAAELAGARGRGGGGGAVAAATAAHWSSEAGRSPSAASEDTATRSQLAGSEEAAVQRALAGLMADTLS
jgi:SpoVK/Ycf46/Vps4 family AAA+-type ATPase